MGDITMNKNDTRKKRGRAAGKAAALFWIFALLMMALFFYAGYFVYHSSFYKLLSKTDLYLSIYRFVSWTHEWFAFLSVFPWYGVLFDKMLTRADVSFRLSRRFRIVCIIALIPFSVYLFVLGAVGAERAEASRANLDTEIFHISNPASPEAEQLNRKDGWRISIRVSASDAPHTAHVISKESYSGSSLFFRYFWRNPSTVFSCLIKNYPVTFYVVELGPSDTSSSSPSSSPSAVESSSLSSSPSSFSSPVKPAVIKIEDPLVIKKDDVLYHLPYEGREVDWDSKRDIEFRGNSGACSAYQAGMEIPIEITESGTVVWSFDSSLPAAQDLLRQKVDIAPGDTAYFYYPSSYFLLDDNALSDLEKEYGAKLRIDKIGFESSLLQQPSIETTDFNGDPVFIKAMTCNEDASIQICCYLNDKKQQDYYVTLAAGNSPSWNAVRPGAPNPKLICNLYLVTKR